MPDNNQNSAPQRREPQPQQGGGGQRQAPRTKARRRKKRPLWLTIIVRFFQVLGTLLLMGVITGCFMICFAVVYVKTAIMPNTGLDLSAYTMMENSVIYYEDKNTGQLVELQTLKGKENRELVTYDQIPEDLINAFVAIEDKRFWNHQGVDWRRTASGLLRMFTGGNIQGGSTIDQQLIKNLTDRNDVTVNRKILEIFTALELEKNYTKEYILTTYLNKIYLGNGCDGVQAAAKYYFGKNVWELDLAECACLAGITNNPSLYAPKGVVDVVRYQCQNPECKLYSLTKDEVCEYCGAENSYDNGSVWTNLEFNKARQENILKEMAKPDEARDGKAYITEAERDAAIAEPLSFKWQNKADPEDPDGVESEPSNIYSWYVEAVIREATQALMDETGHDEKACRTRVFSGGLSIICAYDPEVQAAVDAVYKDPETLANYVSKRGQKAMSNITVVDNSTGYVVALGSTAEKTVNRGSLWPVTSRRQPGSAIKPVSVYAPAIEMGLITPASVFDDNPYLLNGKLWPLNVEANYGGLTTVADAVTVSLNTVALRVVELMTPQASYDFMEKKFGFTTLEPYYVNSLGEVKSDIDRSPLSMGGLTWGVTTFEMAAAYASFPRNGEFKKATTVLEIRDANGNTIRDNRPESTWPISTKTAYYMNSMLTNVVNAGTGTLARIPGQTVAGKTGTTNSKYDLWFCGYTSYYTAAVWVGYKENEQINDNGSRYGPAMKLWKQVMEPLHEGKENAAFPVPENLVSASICVDCGKRATDACAADIRGSRARSFRLFADDVPSESCSCHVPVQICMDSPILDANGEATGRYHLAGALCPEETVRTVYMVNYERELATSSVHIGDANGLVSWYEAIPEDRRYCYVHVEGWEPSPPPTESMDPWDLPSDWPVGSEDPDVTDTPYLPPIPEPSFPPVEPPTPSVEVPAPPPTPSEEPPYIPVDQWGQPMWPTQ